MKDLIFAEVDLPKIPADIITDNFINYYHLNTKYPSENQNLIKNNMPVVPCKYTVGFLSSQLASWLDNNVCWSKSFIRKIQIAESNKVPETTHAVHSDIARRWALNYMITLGGDDAWTSWYKEKEKSLYRFKVNDDQSDSGPVRYENLDIIYSTKFEESKWYLMRVDILHDVHQIINRRSSITISIPTESLPVELSEKILNQHYYKNF